MSASRAMMSHTCPWAAESAIRPVAFRAAFALRAAFASRKGKVQAELIVVHACMQVREQLALKYGQIMMQEAQSNLSFNAPLRIVQLLSYHPPSKVLAH